MFGLKNARQNWKGDLLASLVVFLVALPLCLGIAIASGAPPIAGILSGVIGGLVVATLGGCSMQVSGPANGLIVLVLLVSQQYGLAVLGVIVLAAGALQLIAGMCRLGQLFRAIPPAIIHGLMTGFAVIIFASQFHVLLDAPSRGGAIENLALIPEAVANVFASGGAYQAAIVGVMTIAILLLWKPLAPERLAVLPASLVAVVGATVFVVLSGFAVARVELPDSLLGAIQLLDVNGLNRLLEWPIIEIALVMAFLASTETLLSATAVDQLHQGPRTNYNRELAAQGVGNMICGVVGAIPLTGVIIRSAANVSAGAKTRLSSVLHGLWLLAFVVLLPGLLGLVPTASLAAVLVVAVFKLVNFPALKEIWNQDRREIAIYAATTVTIVVWGVLPGVVLGIGLSLLKLLQAASHLNIDVDSCPDSRRVDLRLNGTVTFLNIPKLAAVLDTVPERSELHINIENVHLIDHACLELLMNWEKLLARAGGTLFINWASVMASFGRHVTTRSPAQPNLVPSRLHSPTETRDSGFKRPGWSVVSTTAVESFSTQ